MEKTFLKKLTDAVTDTAIIHDPKYNPTPIVMRVQNPASAAPMFSSEFIAYVKETENGVRQGYKGSKWFPITDPNGKFQVIAYGHKVVPGDNFVRGITEKEATDLLLKDLQEAYGRADKWLKSKYGRGMNSLPRSSQEILTDFSFNPGSLGVFPKLTDAVMRGDLEGLKREYKRSYADASGNRQELTGRNASFEQLFLNGRG